MVSKRVLLIRSNNYHQSEIPHHAGLKVGSFYNHSAFSQPLTIAQPTCSLSPSLLIFISVSPNFL